MVYIEYLNGKFSFIGESEFYYINIKDNGIVVEATKDNATGIILNNNIYSIKDNKTLDKEKVFLLEDIYWNDDIKNKYNSIIYQQIKERKIHELSLICEKTIVAGTSVKLDTEEFFEYGLEDQGNINEMMNAVAMGALSFPYHSKDSECRVYSREEIVKIYTTLSLFKTKQLTYFNQLKKYIYDTNDINKIINLQYGQELIGEYKNNYNKMIIEAEQQINNITKQIK